MSDVKIVKAWNEAREVAAKVGFRLEIRRGNIEAIQGGYAFYFQTVEGVVGFLRGYGFGKGARKRARDKLPAAAKLINGESDWRE